MFALPGDQNECSCDGYPGCHVKVPAGGAYAADSSAWGLVRPVTLASPVTVAPVPVAPVPVEAAVGVQVSGR
jgi:hypothetical protein